MCLAFFHAIPAAAHAGLSITAKATVSGRFVYDGSTGIMVSFDFGLDYVGVSAATAAAKQTLNSAVQTHAPWLSIQVDT